MNTATCHYYNADGEIKILENQSDAYGSIFFRKFCEEETERIICRILKQYPHPNCVSIYDVNLFSIDMELLDTTVPLDDSHLVDIQEALAHLHKHGIIYIDLKKDNIGYSHKDKKFKLFDFDMSGLVDVNHKSKWLHKPNRGYILYDVNEILKKRLSYELYEIDDLAYQRYLVKELCQS